MSDDPKSFSSFDLDPRLSRAIVQLKFTQPTPVQAKVIPVALAGKDILARARTGSGKTAAFVVPIVQKILQSKDASSEPSIKALILVPTRELAEQVTAHVRKFIIYAKNEIKVVNLAGQMSPQQQRPLLAEKPDIVVSTPSRALAHLEAGNMDLKSSLQNLVIDEADLVLSFGYDEDVRKILTYLPKIYQSFLMSATLTEDIENLKQMILRKPVVLSLEDQCDEAQFLTQYVIKCNEFEKFLYTFIIIKLRLISGKVLLFVNDIDRCYKLKLFLEQFSIKSCVLNSELPLNSRYHIVEEFNRGIYQYLIASDEADLKGEMDTDDEDEGDDNDQQQSKDNGNSAAKKKSKQVRDKEYGVSRGIDFQDVTAVINFDFPKSAKSYTHRVGRTARGGQRGIAMSFVVTKEHMHVDKDVVKDVSRGRDVCDDKVHARVERLQQSKNAQLKPYTFEKKNVEGFKYRVQDALHAVNKAAIKEARITEIKREILNSEKLKAHFEDKPKDLEFLRHDKALQPARVKEHLRNIPSYLMPRVSVPSRAHNNSKFDGPVPFESDKKRKKSGHKKGPAKKRKTDPLKSIKKHR